MNDEVILNPSVVVSETINMHMNMLLEEAGGLASLHCGNSRARRVTYLTSCHVNINTTVWFMF